MAGAVTVQAVGNLAADPELRFTSTGQAVAGLRVACTPRRRGADGQWTDGDTIWLKCTVWGPLAEHVAESLRRGDQVVLSGQLRDDSYEKDGQRVTAHQVVVDHIGPSLQFATARPEKAARSSAGDPAAQLHSIPA